MKFTRKSLAARLVFSAMVVSLVLLLLAGMLLSYLFQVTVERNFDARLEAVMNGLLASIELDEKGRPYLQRQLADPRFQLPFSGWYWQVRPLDGDGEGLVSKSLLEQRLDLSPLKTIRRDKGGVAHVFLTDQNGTSLRAIEQRYSLFGSKNMFSVLVAGNFDELRKEISAFTNALVLILTLLGLGLIVALLVQVRYGLRPLDVLQGELGAIRQGKKEFLEREYPSEIESVAHELNKLIRSNREIVERARTQVGNLAHALKTPLSVLTNEANSEDSPIADKILQQTRIMRDQVNIYLDRARRAASASTLGAVSDVEDVIAAIVRTLLRIHHDRRIDVEVDCLDGLKFRGERQDLEEMVGNLLDNAFKYARSKITVRSEIIPIDHDGKRPMLLISVEDDGSGLPEADWEKALKRGQRLDENMPGSGLGLSIVNETASMYDGKIILGKSAIGGLKVELKLPAVIG